MHTLILTFTQRQAAPVRLTAKRPSEGEDEAKGDFAPPFDADALTVITRALEPGFDPAFSDQDLAVLAELDDIHGLPPKRVQKTLQQVKSLREGSDPRLAQEWPQRLQALVDEVIENVGDRLATALCASDEITEIFGDVLAAARAERRPLRLELRFAAGCDEVAALPWELLRYQQRFLVADNDVTTVRTPLGTTPYPTHHLSLFCRFPGRPATAFPQIADQPGKQGLGCRRRRGGGQGSRGGWVVRWWGWSRGQDRSRARGGVAPLGRRRQRPAAFAANRKVLQD